MKPLQTRWLAIPIIGAAAAALLLWARRWSLPIRRVEVETRRLSQKPPSVPATLDYSSAPMHLLDEGEGPLFFRRYRADIKQPKLSPEAVMQHVQSEINAFCAAELAVFDKTVELAPGKLSLGDEFFIRISGPWNGHVRTVDVTPTSFTFTTLEEHMERGAIRFQIQPHPTQPELLRFEITSWARSVDKLVDFMYDTLGIAKLAQESLWAFFCQRVVDFSGGELAGEIEVLTEKAPYRGERISKDPSIPPQYRPYFERYQQAKLNYEYDPEKQHEFTEAAGWLIDEYSVALPPEAPGEPEPNGSWELARDIIRNYEFPDPRLVTGIFTAETPLEKRLMIIRARFLLWTFYFGVRVNRVIDEARTQDGRPTRIWGYSYQTLEGHFEMGEITFEVWKFTDSGEVEFHVHAYSRTAVIPNPFYRLGFRLFGRRLQKYFADSSLERMVTLVKARLPEASATDAPIG